MISANQALERLQEGNQRFVSGTQTRGALADEAGHRRGLLPQTEPIAVILGCSDSRVPVETVFDQGLGDLFVVRVAGNIAAPSQIGSVEFATERFGTPLVVVLGHSFCGAVMATIEDLEKPSTNQSPGFREIVEAIRPAVEQSKHENGTEFAWDLLQRAVRANIRASIDRLTHGSKLLGQLVRKEELSIVGAEYSLATGIVEFLPTLTNDT